jgi:uncharacterized protein (DUF952 family)
VIYHLALPAAWAEAQRTGSYDRSTRDASLAEVGFVHCSEREQLSGTRARFYADLPQVLVLSVDETGLDVRRELAGEELFPHVYGPIPVGSVVAVERWAAGQAEPG